MTARGIAGRLGVGGRLLIAFLGISAFAVLAAVAGIHAFLQVGKVVERITAARVPAALDLLDLSRQVQRIVAAAPALLTVGTASEHDTLSAAIRADTERIQRLMNGSGRSLDESPAIGEIESGIVRLIDNLERLDALVGERLAAAEHKEMLLRRLTMVFQTMQRQLSPRLRVLDSEVARLTAAVERGTAGMSGGVNADASLPGQIMALLPVQRAQVEVSTLNDRLTHAAATATPEELSLAAFPIHRSLAALEMQLPMLEPALAQALEPRIREFRGLAEGAGGIPAARQRELQIVSDSQHLLAENTSLSFDLTSAVDRLVAGARRDIAAGSAEIAAVRQESITVLVLVVVLSLASATLIVWRYVGRNIIARLTALSDSMLAIAGGRLEVVLPAEGGDEIGRMAGALKVFRATAIEAEAARRREVSEARHRLTTALESISEGFALFDADDCILQCNSKFRELLGQAVGPAAAARIGPGDRFADLLHTAGRERLALAAGSPAEAWIAARLAGRQGLGGTLELCLTNGTWLQISERQTQDGGIVAVYTNITDVKHREEELRIAKDLAEKALSELREAQYQLVVQEKLASLGQLVAGVAHEINTPVGTMLTGASFLAKQTTELQQAYAAGRMRRGDFETYLEVAGNVTGLMSNNIARVAALVQSFKQVAVDETSGERRRFHLQDYLAELLLSLGPQIRTTPHTPTVDCPPGVTMDSYPAGVAGASADPSDDERAHACLRRRSGRAGAAGTDGDHGDAAARGGGGAALRRRRQGVSPPNTCRRSSTRSSPRAAAPAEPVSACTSSSTS